MTKQTERQEYRGDPAIPTVDYSLATTLHALRNRNRRHINYTTTFAVAVGVLYVLSLIFFH